MHHQQKILYNYKYIKQPGAVEITLSQIPKGGVYLKPLSLEHFRNSLAKTKRTVKDDDIKKFDKWTEEYGEEGK